MYLMSQYQKASILILEVRKLRHRELQELASGRTASTTQAPPPHGQCRLHMAGTPRPRQWRVCGEARNFSWVKEVEHSTSFKPLRPQVDGSNSQPTSLQLKEGLYSIEDKTRKAKGGPGVGVCTHTVATFQLQGPWFLLVPSSLWATLGSLRIIWGAK